MLWTLTRHTYLFVDDETGGFILLDLNDPQLQLLLTRENVERADDCPDLLIIRSTGRRDFES
jgi:hypothetical protein